ncbi:19653_t:CDS:2, partial [Funneliformis geosporum]
ATITQHYGAENINRSSSALIIENRPILIYFLGIESPERRAEARYCNISTVSPFSANDKFRATQNSITLNKTRYKLWDSPHVRSRPLKLRV